MKYKVGDKVRVKTELVVNKSYRNIDDNLECCIFAHGMEAFKRKTYIIKNLLRDRYILEGCEGWYFVDEMLDPVPVETYKIVITAGGTDINAMLYDGKKIVKTTTAKCSPADTYDFATGARLAFDRLMSTEEKSRVTSIPHLEDNGLFYGAIGEPTEYKDLVGRPLAIGDIVEIFDPENTSCGYESVVNFKGKVFVMGIEGICENGEILEDWKIIKVKSHSDTKHGEKYGFIEVFKEPKESDSK